MDDAERKSEPTEDSSSEPTPDTTSESGADSGAETKTESSSGATSTATKSDEAATKTSTSDKPTSRRKDKDKDDSEERSRSKSSASDTVRSVRSGAATAVWTLAVIAALILAAGALVIALDFNPKNGIVQFFRDTADRINFLGELKSFEPSGRGADAKQSALVKTVLVNWGICAIVYLVAGKVLDRVIRP